MGLSWTFVVVFGKPSRTKNVGGKHERNFGRPESSTSGGTHGFRVSDVVD